MSFTSQHDHDVKEQIRQATDIVDLVGSYLQLRRQGRGYVALCPWHDDSRPSLQVNPQRQSWKCWVCDEGGDIFNFVMKQENIGFREALEMLADRAGITLRSTPQPKAQPGSPDDKQTLYRAVAWAEQQFHQCLQNAPEAEPARRYLEQRGINQASIDGFQLGFSPDSWQWILDRARSTPFSAQVLEAAGICAVSPNSGRHYDRFKGRVMFSIRDPQGRPIAFGGRILPELADQRAAKYINSPETRLFSKSDQLYALHLARNAVTNPESKSREIVVVEGYTDVVMAHQMGVQNVVACLGTALGQRHIRVLRRFADTIYLVLDGDVAGQTRTNEILELFVAEQVDLRILTLPQGLDPCDFLLDRGGQAFRELLGNAVDALEHKIRVATEGINLASDTHRANLALESVLSTLAKAPKATASGTPTNLLLREQQMLAKLARQFGLSEGDLRVRVEDLRRQAQRRTVPHDAPSAGRSDQPIIRVRDMEPREVGLMEVLVMHAELVEPTLQQIRADQIQAAPLKYILNLMQSILDANGQPDFGNVLTALDDPRLKNIWVEIDERAHAKAEDAQTDAQDRWQGLIESFHYADQAKHRGHEQAALEEQRMSDQEALDALQRLIAQERDRQGISAPTDG